MSSTKDLEEGAEKRIEINEMVIEPEKLDANDAEKLDAAFSLDFTSGLVNIKDDINTPAFTVRSVLMVRTCAANSLLI